MKSGLICLAVTLLIMMTASCTSSNGTASNNRLDPKWQFVVDYAPMVWMAVDEKYFPSDIEYVLENTNPT